MKVTPVGSSVAFAGMFKPKTKANKDNAIINFFILLTPYKIFLFFKIITENTGIMVKFFENY